MSERHDAARQTKLRRTHLLVLSATLAITDPHLTTAQRWIRAARIRTVLNDQGYTLLKKRPVKVRQP